MDWLLRNIPLLIFLFVAISIVRAVLQAKRQQEKSQAEHDETDQQRRVREIQEQIRRKIAERRGETAPQPPPLAPREPPALAPRVPPPARAEPRPAVPHLDPFGGAGTLKRALEEIERRLQPAPEPPKPETRRAEVQRQVDLEEQLRVAEEGRHLALRRAAHIAAERAEVERSESALLTSARARLLADISDPQSLRRAFVLREVLGPPVGLR